MRIPKHPETVRTRIRNAAVFVIFGIVSAVFLFFCFYGIAIYSGTCEGGKETGTYYLLYETTGRQVSSGDWILVREQETGKLTLKKQGELTDEERENMEPIGRIIAHWQGGKSE